MTARVCNQTRRGNPYSASFVCGKFSVFIYEFIHGFAERTMSFSLNANDDQILCMSDRDVDGWFRVVGFIFFRIKLLIVLQHISFYCLIVCVCVLVALFRFAVEPIRVCMWIRSKMNRIVNSLIVRVAGIYTTWIVKQNKFKQNACR